MPVATSLHVIRYRIIGHRKLIIASSYSKCRSLTEIYNYIVVMHTRTAVDMTSVVTRLIACPDDRLRTAAQRCHLLSG
eukprot:scaffold8320_cov27-Prasinocladus_malaysianus.AAC.2